MQIERVSYLSNFEELVNQYGVGIQHVFSDDPQQPGFSYTVGLFEADHAEFIAFGFGPELAQLILNDLANAVLRDDVRFTANCRVHQLFRGAPAHLMPARDVGGDYFGTSYAIRNRRRPELAGSELPVLHLLYQDPSGRWAWEDDSDYAAWPRLADWPDPHDAKVLTVPRAPLT